VALSNNTFIGIANGVKPFMDKIKILHCLSYVMVPYQLLYYLQVSAIVEQVGGKAVPSCMDGIIFRLQPQFDVRLL
jgi:hypothetical protein